MQEYVFAPFGVSSSDIMELANAMYKYGFEHDAYEPSSYALYWAIINDLTINVESENKVFATGDCVFMTLSYIYSSINKMGKVVLNNYKSEAARLLATDFDRFWLFVYEVLPQTKLKDSFKNIKMNKISFIKQDIKNKM